MREAKRGGKVLKMNLLKYCCNEKRRVAKKKARSIFTNNKHIIMIYFTGENGAALHNVVLKCVTIGAIFPMVSRQASAVLAASLTLMCDW